jgi:excinuclease UvrABC ATPase subunit
VLQEVGLGYLQLGQPLSTLSGGECQRVKLASELHKKGNIYIMNNADWIIDIGPEDGKNGGELIFERTPIEIQVKSKSYTSKFLNLYNSSNLTSL